jgi:hypothetical protein
MSWSHKIALCGFAALGAAMVSAPTAWAGCGNATVQPSAYVRGSAGLALTPVDLGSQGIVGLWSVSLMAGGAQIDWGYSEWHSDGTEIMNSGGHSPASGNFCLGVWRQSGPNSYHLKHYPLAYDPTTGNLAARIILTEDVTVGQGGQTFSGSFSLDVYDPTGATLLQHVPGSITGRRVQPN